MVSSIPYRASKEPNVRHPFGTLVLVVLVLAVVAQEPMLSLFVFCAGYVVSGPLEWAWRRLTKRPLPELDVAEPVEEAQP
jgi:phosphatidylserine synthase